MQREVRYGENSRVDFVLRYQDAPDLYLEVKSVTLLRRAGLAEFPDTVTARGAKHMGELAQMLEAGYRAAVLYLVQRSDAEVFALADDIDPTYTAAAAAARAKGLETYVFGTNIARDGITIGAAVPLAGPDRLASLRQVP